MYQFFLVIIITSIVIANGYFFLLAPQPASTVSGTTSDYSKASQGGLYPNYGTGNNSFCSRGHYVPCGDFNTLDERKLTFINTNVAPQWQLFNGGGGNWAQLEAAIRAYVASSKAGKLYVFTGTGERKYLDCLSVWCQGLDKIPPVVYFNALHGEPDAKQCDFIFRNLGAVLFVGSGWLSDQAAPQWPMIQTRQGEQTGNKDIGSYLKSVVTE